MTKTKKPFVDFRAIRERITMEQVLEHYGVLGKFKRTGIRLSGPCPIHNGNNPSQFRVDTEKNIWNCFSECKHGGNVLDFIAKKEDVSIHDAAIKACEWFNIPVDEVKSNGSSQEEPADAPKVSAKADSKPALMRSPAKEDNTPNPPLKFKLEKLQREHLYLIERGLTQETIIDFGLGYFTGEKGLMVGRIVIPINNVKGELVAYAGRWPGEPPDKDTPKYKLPTGFRKGLELFNWDRARKEPREDALVIVEGFFDCMKLWQLGIHKVVALMGSSMSPSQERLILEHTNALSRVLIMLDEDEAGRAGRQDILQRLGSIVFAKVHVFETEGQQPEHLSAETVDELFV